jgi:hypothetical protein
MAATNDSADGGGGIMMGQLAITEQYFERPDAHDWSDAQLAADITTATSSSGAGISAPASVRVQLASPERLRLGADPADTTEDVGPGPAMAPDALRRAREAWEKEYPGLKKSWAAAMLEVCSAHSPAQAPRHLRACAALSEQASIARQRLNTD